MQKKKVPASQKTTEEPRGFRLCMVDGFEACRWWWGLSLLFTPLAWTRNRSFADWRRWGLCGCALAPVALVTWCWDMRQPGAAQGYFWELIFAHHPLYRYITLANIKFFFFSHTFLMFPFVRKIFLSSVKPPFFFPSTIFPTWWFRVIAYDLQSSLGLFMEGSYF